jgi:pilus assembly protein CpaB
MQARSIVMLVPALVLAAGAAFAARNWLDAERRSLAPPPAVERPVNAVLVAKKALSLGHILKPEDLAWQPWPSDTNGMPYILTGAGKPEDFAGWVVRAPLVAGEPVTAERMVAPGERGFLAAVLYPGMRAASVAVTATSGISGFVFPGDRVDILLTHILPEPPGETSPAGSANVQRRATETVLRDIRVLAVDQKVDSKDKEAVVARTATLEVTDKESELLALVAEMGKLTLSLRSLASDDAPPTDQSLSPKPSYTLDTQASHLLSPTRLGAVGRVAVLHGGKADELSVPGDKK